MIPAHVSRVYLSPDQLRRLHFKPTIGSIQLSEGHEVKFNCSIDIPDARVEPTISWVKNGQELEQNQQVVVNDLSTTTDGVATLLSTVRYATHGGKKLCDRLVITEIDTCPLYYSISHVQRVDAGEYRCRLSISTTMVESQPITIEVEGEFQCDARNRCFLGRPFFMTQL